MLKHPPKIKSAPAGIRAQRESQPADRFLHSPGQAAQKLSQPPLIINADDVIGRAHLAPKDLLTARRAVRFGNPWTEAAGCTNDIDSTQ